MGGVASQAGFIACLFSPPLKGCAFVPLQPTVQPLSNSLVLSLGSRISANTKRALSWPPLCLFCSVFPPFQGNNNFHSGEQNLNASQRGSEEGVTLPLSSWDSSWGGGVGWGGGGLAGPSKLRCEEAVPVPEGQLRQGRIAVAKKQPGAGSRIVAEPKTAAGSQGSRHQFGACAQHQRLQYPKNCKSAPSQLWQCKLIKRKHILVSRQQLWQFMFLFCTTNAGFTSVVDASTGIAHILSGLLFQLWGPEHTHGAGG